VMTERSEVKNTVLNTFVTTYVHRKNFVFSYYHCFQSLVLYISYAHVSPAYPSVRPSGCIIQRK
jgi:hypothetical protein